MHKIKPANLSAIAKTLLVPLYFRAVESQRQDPLVADPLALELVKQIDYDFPRFAANDLIQATVMLKEALICSHRCPQLFPKALIVF